MTIEEIRIAEFKSNLPKSLDFIDIQVQADVLIEQAQKEAKSGRSGMLLEVTGDKSVLWSNVAKYLRIKGFDVSFGDRIAIINMTPEGRTFMKINWAV